MSKEIIKFDTKQLAEKKPLKAVAAAIEEIRSFPVGILDEDERDKFASEVANLEEIQAIARKKGLELGFPAKKTGFWDRFRKQQKQNSELKSRELKYNGLPVHTLSDDLSVSSDNQWRIGKATLDPNKTYQYVGKAHYLPHEDDHDFDDYRTFLRKSEYGRDFIKFGYIDPYSEIGDTFIQLKGHKGLPIFIVHVRKQYGDTKTIGAYIIEPTDPDKQIYHVCFPTSYNNFKDRILEIKKTDKSGVFEVRQIEESTDPGQ